jgi:putative endonuclease
MEEKYYYVYIMANKVNTVLYTGITNDLAERVWQHKQKLAKGFTSKYNVNKLVYYEVFDNPVEAITREKQIKAGSRKKKVELIKRDNPEWRDLSEDLSL